jgi:LysM repeat protein
MQKKHTLTWLGLGMTLLLSGCVRTVFDTPTMAPQVVDVTPTVTPIVTFNETPMPEPTSAFPPSVYFEPSVTDLEMGQTTTINVWIEEARQLNAIALELSFNPNQIQVDDSDLDTDGIQIIPGELPNPDEVIRNQVEVGDEGRIYYEVSQAPDTTAEGSGIIASIVLRGVGAGLTPLSIEDVSGYDTQGSEVEVSALSNGLINIAAGDAGDAAPTSEPTEEPAATTSAQPTQTAPATTPTPSPSPPSTTSGGIYYVIQSGENLYRLGLRFDTTAGAIAAASSIADPGDVQAGTLVLIPVPPPQGNYGYYVQRRDTAYSIARRFGMSVGELAALNGIGSDYHIEPGQILIVTP